MAVCFCFVFFYFLNSSVFVGYFWICIPCPQRHLLQQYTAVWLPKNCWQYSGWYFLHAEGSSQIITCGKCWLMYTLWLYSRKHKPVSQMTDEHSIFIPVEKNMVLLIRQKLNLSWIERDAVRLMCACYYEHVLTWLCYFFVTSWPHPRD